MQKCEDGGGGEGREGKMVKDGVERMMNIEKMMTVIVLERRKEGDFFAWGELAIILPHAWT